MSKLFVLHHLSLFLAWAQILMMSLASGFYIPQQPWLKIAAAPVASGITYNITTLAENCSSACGLRLHIQHNNLG
jgi:hypothetical protein